MTADAAQTAITQDGHFKMGETKESYSSSVEQGKVMDQDPRASRQMPEGTTINIVISKGERIAQLVIQRVPQVHLREVEQLDETDRGEGGFGSSGVN